jgi:hypothetical protein
VRETIGFVVIGFILPVALCASQAATPAEPAKQATTRPDTSKGAVAKAADAEAAALAAMMPGPAHARMARLAGDWSIETSMSMPGGGEPTKSAGTASIAMALDGRFVHETGVGEMMGMPVHSFKQWGYNVGSKKYEGVWSWTLSTGLLQLAGESKDDGKTIEWRAGYDNEFGKREEFNVTMTFADDDHFTVKIHGGKMPDGSPGPVMEAKYSRKK